MHVQAYDFVERNVADIAPGASVLEIGSHDVNGSVRPLLRDTSHYHGIDIAAGPGVDEVADAADWHAPRRYDVVISTEVLEHAPRWYDVLDNAWDALEDGGRLLFTFATDPRPAHSAIDGWEVREGEHYANVSPAQVMERLRAWSATSWRIEVALDRGDLFMRVDKPLPSQPAVDTPA